jgi:hypothetical protein
LWGSTTAPFMYSSSCSREQHSKGWHSNMVALLLGARSA